MNIAPSDLTHGGKPDRNNSNSDGVVIYRIGESAHTIRDKEMDSVSAGDRQRKRKWEKERKRDQ